MKRVYCLDCKYLNINAVNITGSHRCAFPENTRIEKRITWLQVEIITIFTSEPSQLNQFNDCLWFEKRGE